MPLIQCLHNRALNSENCALFSMPAPQPGVPSGAISKGAPAAGCALETSSVSVWNLVVGWGWLWSRFCAVSRAARNLRCLTMKVSFRWAGGRNLLDLSLTCSSRVALGSLEAGGEALRVEVVLLAASDGGVEKGVVEPLVLVCDLAALRREVGVVCHELV